MTEQLRILSIGAGNVAYHLMFAFNQAGHKITQVYSRKLSNAKVLANMTDSAAISKMDQVNLDCDLIIISIPDEHIANMSSNLGLESFEGIVVHTSGSTPTLSKVKHSAVLYPLQSFNKNRDINFLKVPIFITATQNKIKLKLKKLAEQISERVYYIDDKKRRELHLSAVVLNNFMHHLAFKSEEYLKSKNLKFEYLDALMETSFEKILEKRLKQSQTGPARRGDLKTIREHKKLLAEDKSLLNLYETFTNSILETYGHN